MSQRTHSQDSVSDPRNEDDYDTWEYGTEPLPDDHTWKTKTFEEIWEDMDAIEPLTPVQDSIRAYREAAKSDAFLFGDYDAFQAYKLAVEEG